MVKAGRVLTHGREALAQEVLAGEVGGLGPGVVDPGLLEVVLGGALRLVEDPELAGRLCLLWLFFRFGGDDRILAR